MTRLIQYLIISYIFFISWVDSFMFGRWLRIHVIIALLLVMLFLFSLLRGFRVSLRAYKFEDIFLLMLLPCLSISAIKNSNSHTINYILAYLYTFWGAFLILKGVFCNVSNWRKALNANTLGIMFVSLFVICEFCLEYFWSIDIQEYIHRDREARATYIGVFSRSYGLATEPTILAFYFNTLGPIGMWNLCKWYNWNRIWKKAAVIVFVIAWVTTFSAAGLVFLPASIIISCGLIMLKKSGAKISVRKVLKVWLVMGLILTSFAFAQSKYEITRYALPLWRKISLQQTGYMRPQKWREGIETIKKHIILGQGLGARSESGRSSNINWYIFLTAEGGVISSVPILLFLFFTFIRIYQSNVGGKLWFMSGFLAGTMHLMVVSTFFHPFLWLLIILFFMSNNNWCPEKIRVAFQGRKKVRIRALSSC